jgi:5-methylcytosine-specific restriction enzyme subunit McrC
MADAERRGGRIRRDSLVVNEHTSAQVPRGLLTAADLRRLHRLRDEGRIGLRETPSGWTLSARATVGVLVLDQVRLALHPKIEIPGEQLITWLCYAQGTRPVPHEPALRRWLIGSSGYAAIALAALLAECRNLLHDGLRRDYVPAERVEPVLRGRLDVRAQATRRYGAVDRLHVRTFERDEHIWENLVCGAALSQARERAWATDPQLARALAETAARFPQPTHPDEASGMLARARYNRLNDRYRTAHAWSRLILGGGGVTDLLTERGLHADSMLLNMNVLWERVVRQMAHDIAAEFGGECQRSDSDPGIRTSGDIGKRHKPFAPDVLVRLPGPSPRFLPVDAKYKTYAGKRVSSTDRHQLLTYIAGYATPDTPLAAVVHPAPHGEPGRTLTITGPRGRRLGVIELLGLDTRLPPHHAAEPLRAIISRFAAAGTAQS